MIADQNKMPQSWLAFDLNVLRRLDFKSVILPVLKEPSLGVYLKRRNARVIANDLALASYTQNIAAIQNNNERLLKQDLDVVLEDVYVPRHRLENQSLAKYFSETDAWWFDNVRQNIEKLSSPIAKAIASTIAMQTGDYAQSFSQETAHLRQPLSKVFERLLPVYPAPINNGQNNGCTNLPINDFIAGNFGDLMFFRLPKQHNLNLRDSFGNAAWREEWLTGNADFWAEKEISSNTRLGARTETKSQYLNQIEEVLRTASHINKWAIAHVEDGSISTQEICEIIARLRRVDTVFTKDFSEMTNSKAVIITA